MVDKSIAYRLSFYVSVAVILVFMAFILAYFLFNQRLLRENLENKAVGLSSEVSSTIDREVRSVRDLTANLAGQVDYYYRHGDLEELLRQVLVKYPYLSSVQVHFDTLHAGPFHYFSIYRSGNRLEYEQLPYPVFSSQTKKEKFRLAGNAEAPGWTEPYIDQESGKIVASFYYPIITAPANNRMVTGHISSNLSLSDLNASINQLKIGKRGYAFVVDEKGNYITHPDEKKILNSNLLAVSQKVLNNNNLLINKIFAERMKGSTIAYPEMLDYEKSWVYFSPVPETRWFLVFIMPYHELYRELYGVTLWMSLFALSGMVLIYFLVSYIIRKQIKPLSTVTSKLSSFSSPFKLNTENEVKQVANSLEYLKVWFEQYQASREREELNTTQHQRDLQQASEIQQSLIKTSFPAFPNRRDIDVHAIYKPAQTVSGDLFDFYFIDENNLVFTIGDVSGKGIPAAIFMSVCQTVIKNNSRLKDPRKIVEKTNFELSKSNHHQYFLTLFLGVLDVHTGQLSYCNAAHPFPLILKSNGELTEVKSTHGLPLGLYPEKEYGAEQTSLEAGDTILLYTDGVFDALNEKNILSGSKWFQKNIRKVKNLSPKGITTFLENELAGTESSHTDDICLMAIQYLP